jgi:ribosomal protein S18 acetylase RimI-like enzyme
LRKAGVEDLDFIWRLRTITMKPLIETTGEWIESTQRRYAQDSLKGEIVLVDNAPVGVITIADWGDQLHLVWMAIHPDFQRRGLGRKLIEHAQDQARQASKPLSLQALRENPAVKLYMKCGFNVYDVQEQGKLLMRWIPGEAG